MTFEDKCELIVRDWFNSMLGFKVEKAAGQFSHFDLVGKTPKGYDCVIEIKTRDKYYPTKMLEKYKYDKIMSLNPKFVKLYVVWDSKGLWTFHLNNLTMPQVQTIGCPKTSRFDNNQKTGKQVYNLPESLALNL